MFGIFCDHVVRAIEKAAHLLYKVSIVMILAMMLLTVYDVGARYFFGSPLVGAYEYTEFLLVIIVASALAFAQISKRHVSVELLVARLPFGAQKFVNGLSGLVCLGIYALITWQGLKGAQMQWRNGVTSGAYSIPLWPFYVFLAFGCGILCLAFLADLLKLFRGKEDKV